MVLLALLIVPLLGILYITSVASTNINNLTERSVTTKSIKLTALTVSIINMTMSLVVFILFDFSTNQYQFVQESHEISNFNIYLGIDGLSIYFVLLTTIITPIALLSN